VDTGAIRRQVAGKKKNGVAGQAGAKEVPREQ